MSIFKSTFPEGVIKQLNARQEIMAKRDATAITYLNSRTAWIRMTSAVDVNGSDNYAKNNILLGGALYNNKHRTGVGTTGENAYSTNTSIGNKHRLGMRPMPGITSIEVKNKGAYGSLREITVNFQCWDIKQLEELELLYMRSGYSVLVEWGWMPYLTNSKGLGNSAKLTDDVLNGGKTKESGGKTKEEIWKTIFEKASEDGNYDAIYGFIQNYNWSARPDGGYDCTTTLITMGEVLESLKVNYGAYDIGVIKDGGTGLFGVLDSTKFEKETPINKSYSQNKLAGMLNEIWDIAKEKSLLGNLTAFDFDLKGTTYDFFRYDLTVARNASAGIKDSFVEEDQQIYITLEGFVDLMNKHILLEDTKAKKPLIALSVKEGAHNGGKEGDPLLCLGHRFQLSVDPTVCLIKNPNWSNPEANLGITTNDTDTETIKSIMNSKMKDYFKTSEDGGLFGIIGNIYVNLGYLYGLIVSDDLASQDPKEKRDINLYDYMKNILSGINSSIGNVATLDMFIDSTDSVGRIIDLNYIDMQSREKIYESAFPLEVHNLSSTVRSYSLESQVFPDQTTTVAIGAQAGGGGALGIDSNIMLEFNRGLKDRIIPKRKAPNDDDKDDKEAALKSKIESLKTSLEIILSYINKTDPSWYEHAGDFDVSDSSKYANALKDIIQFDKSLFKNDNKNRNIIPTKLSLEMDGIGGIVVGNIFKINEDILPKGYKGEKIGAKIAFVVNEIGASINSNNDWVTKIGAQFIVLDKPNEGAESSKWDDIKNTIIKTAVAVVDIEKLQELGQQIIEIGNNKVTKGKIPKSMTTFQEVCYAVINNLEGGYFHPNMLKDGRVKDSKGYMTGIDPKTGKKIPGIKPSGETMYGLDRINGGAAVGSCNACKQFWGLLDKANAPNTWDWLHIPPDPLKSQLINLAVQIMEPLFNSSMKSFVRKDIQDVIKSDGRLYFNFVYAQWNGPGWFQGFAKEITSAYDRGTKDPEALATLFVRRRTNNIGIVKNTSNNVLIHDGGVKISKLVGLA